MSVQAICLHNLFLFKNSGWFELRPVTFLYGRNSSGKSAIGQAFLILQRTWLLEFSENKSVIPGIKNFSRVCCGHYSEDASPTVVTFEFKCLPQLGLVSKVSEFSSLRDLNLQEENEAVVFQISYQKINRITNDDIGIISSVAINLFESRSVKDEITGNWCYKKKILEIHRDNSVPETWVFESDFLDIELLNDLLNKITVDEFRAIPILKAKEGDLYPLLAFSEDELAEESYDPYKNPDDPRNVIRYLDRFLRTLSSDVLKFIDAIKFVEPVIEERQTVYPAVSREKSSIIITDVQNWGINFYDAILSTTELKSVIDSLLSGNFEPQRKFFGHGLLNSSRILLDLLLLERDNIVFMQYPDIFLDINNQLALADFLAVNAIRDEKKIVIETHSEYLLLRIKKRLRQINGRRLPDALSSLKDDFTHKKVGILLFAKNQDGMFRCQTINLDEDGEFIENWPGGFFEEGTFERFDS